MNFHFRLRLKIICSVCILIFSGNNSFGQIKIGIKVTSSSISAKQSSNEYWVPQNKELYNLSYLSTRNSYGFGLSLYSENEKIFVLTDLIYKETTTEFGLSIDDFSRKSDSVFDRHKILSIPIVGGLKFNNIKAGLGPMFGVKLESQYGLAEYSGFNVQSRKLQKGIQFLIGIKIKDHLHVDLRHEFSLGSEGDDYTIVGNPLKIHSHPQSFSVSVGFFL